MLALSRFLCVVAVSLVAACGDDPNAVDNQLPVVIDAGPDPTGEVNILYATVRLCQPDQGTLCQDIDHIQIDTGSTGLRIIASALSADLSLPQRTLNGEPLVECMQFADGFSWGSVRSADLELAGEEAAGMAIQLIADPTYPSTTVPADCASAGPEEDSVATFGANGILGIGNFLQDCGAGCASGTPTGAYYVCPTPTTCRATAIEPAAQLQNPVSLFANDNNGVVLALPTVASPGTVTMAGSLYFGVDTQGDNAPGSAVVVTLDSDQGTFTTSFESASMDASYVDSGSNAYFFEDADIPVCGATSIAAGFFCPPTSLNGLVGTIVGNGGHTTTEVAFGIDNAEALMQDDAVDTVLPGLAAPNGGDATSFVWGLPFFLGRSVFIGFEGQSPGSYVAY